MRVRGFRRVSVLVSQHMRIIESGEKTINSEYAPFIAVRGVRNRIWRLDDSWLSGTAAFAERHVTLLFYAR